MGTADPPAGREPATPQPQPTAGEVYANAQAVYLRFTEWREKVFAGYIALLVVLAAGYGWAVVTVPAIQWLVPAAGAAAVLLLALLEGRTRWLIDAARQTAAACESAAGRRGFSTRLQEHHDGGRLGFSHGRVLRGAYRLTAAVLVLLAALVAWRPVEKAAEPAKVQPGVVAPAPG